MAEKPFDTLAVKDGHHILSDQERKLYGPDLEAEKLYVLKFLFNDQWNNAGDPRPYRIKPELLEKLANDAIGKPWVVPQYGEALHIRAPEDTAASLLEYQAKFSVGEIRKTITNPQTHNVYGIIEVWPEFEGAVNNDLIPPFVSPTVYNHKEDSDGLIEAEFLNIQSVPSPGYPPHLAGISGICKGGINQCILELKTLGSAKMIQKTRNDPKLFSNMLKNILGAMSDPTETGTTGTKPDGAKPDTTDNKDVIAKIDEVKTVVEEVKKEVTEVKEMEVKIIEAVAEVATEAEGVDEAKIKEILPDVPTTTGTTPEPKPDTSTLGASKNTSPQVLELMKKSKEMQTKFDTLQSKYDKESAARAAKTRLDQATRITENMIKMKQVEEAKKDDTIKFYNELKGEDGNLKDLSLLADVLPKTTEKVLGAAGNSEYSMLSDDSLGASEITDDQILNEVNL